MAMLDSTLTSYQGVYGEFTLKDLTGFPYIVYMDNQVRYSELESWYTGAALDTNKQGAQDTEDFPYNSIRRGMEERDTGVPPIYWGKVFYIPGEDLPKSQDDLVERCTEEMVDVLSNLPERYEPGGRVEIIGARDPKSGEHQMVVRVPTLRAGTSVRESRQPGSRG